MAKTRVGKHVLETLTLGMYEDPKAIYREYVQNSVDQIDKAQEQDIFNKSDTKGSVHITIDKHNKTIEIYDNATGIIHEKALDILRHIAESEKDSRKTRGFRGIGRLGGLGYCEELIFETTAREEDKKTMIKWNAAKLKKLLHDKSEKREAGELIDEITSQNTDSEDINKHYFKVRMQNVTNIDLLDVSMVRDYLEMVAPVPYSRTFSFKSEISKFLESNQIPVISEYPVYVNHEEIFKPYLTHIYEASDSNKKKSIGEVQNIEKFLILNSKNELLAWGWYSIHYFNDRKVRVLPKVNKARSLRLRKGNIQIGAENCLAKLHKEDRFNGYFFGEIHAIHEDLIPNARRDYFEDGKILKDFEKKIEQCFKEGTDHLIRLQSKIASEVKKIQKYEDLKKDYTAPGKTYTTKKEKEDLEESIKKEEVIAEEARKKLSKIQESTQSNDSFKTVYETITKPLNFLVESPSEASPLTASESKKISFETDSLYALNKKERKLVSKIFEIINDVLGKDLADNLKEKIKERLNAKN